MDCVWRRLKRAARWVYDWITVLVASLVGAPTLLLQAISFFDGVDFTPFVGADKAIKIVTAVAIVKGILSLLENIARKKGWIE